MDRAELDHRSQSKETAALLAPELAAPLVREKLAPPDAGVPFERTGPLEEASEYAGFLARRRFDSLDGLRTIGILAVVWHHAVGGPGRFGANLFFLLSGFLVTTLLVRERGRKGTIDVLGFHERRARRLYPLYFTVLAGYVGLVYWGEPHGPARSEFLVNLPYFATFTSNLFVGYGGERVIFYFAWSLAVQEQFYLVWPALLKRLNLRTCALAVGALVGATLAIRSGLLASVLPPAGLARSVATSFMPALGLGALLALGLHARAGFELLNRLLSPRWLSCGLLLLALTLWRVPQLPEILILTTLTALTAASVVREDHALARFLTWRPMAHIGTVSYGIYLLHMLCHNSVGRGLHALGLASSVLDFVLSAALAVGVATLSHRHFESRFLVEKRPTS